MSPAPAILDGPIALAGSADAGTANAELLAPLEKLEQRMLQDPQIDAPVTHRFAPWVYMREVLMPAGALIIGHQHRTAHLNIISEGRATVLMDGEVHEIVAPCTLLSHPDVRKVLFIHETMRWATIHPTADFGLAAPSEQDLPLLEEKLIQKSATYTQHHLDMERLKNLLNLTVKEDAP